MTPMQCLKWNRWKCRKWSVITRARAPNANGSGARMRAWRRWTSTWVGSRTSGTHCSPSAGGGDGHTFFGFWVRYNVPFHATVEVLTAVFVCPNVFIARNRSVYVSIIKSNFFLFKTDFLICSNVAFPLWYMCNILIYRYIKFSW